MLMKSGTGPFAAYDVQRDHADGHVGVERHGAQLPRRPRRRCGWPDGGPIFDGFLLTSTNGNTPLPIVDVPMIQMPTQTEVRDVGRDGHRLPPARQRRAGQPLPALRSGRHAAQQLARQPGVCRTIPCTLPVTDFPAGAFTALALNHLVEWIANGKTPPHAPPIAVDQNTANDGSHLALDEHGNAKGGIRNVWVDVPIATYGVFGKGKTTAQDRLCQLAGTEVPLPEATLKKLYREQEPTTPKQVERRLQELVAEGWFLPEYVRVGQGRREGDGDSVEGHGGHEDLPQRDTEISHKEHGNQLRSALQNCSAQPPRPAGSLREPRPTPQLPLSAGPQRHTDTEILAFSRHTEAPRQGRCAARSAAWKRVIATLARHHEPRRWRARVAVTRFSVRADGPHAPADRLCVGAERRVIREHASVPRCLGVSCRLAPIRDAEENVSVTLCLRGHVTVCSVSRFK